MRIPTTVSDMIGKEEYLEVTAELDNSISNHHNNDRTITNNKSRKSRRRQRRNPTTASPVQRLLETCREVFTDSGTNFVPPLEDVERLRAVLGKYFGVGVWFSELKIWGGLDHVML